RQYRDANFAVDDPRAPKTMLGREQLTWLKARLTASDAVWKVVVSSVPMSIPTGFPATNGRDGWANFDQQTGYEHELVELLRFLERQRVRNVVFVTTDVHFASGFRYTPFAESPAFRVHELVTGPTTPASSRTRASTPRCGRSGSSSTRRRPRTRLRAGRKRSAGLTSARLWSRETGR
ncbi:MAG: alkaline phosphatase D family protein, partial [Actinomycetota bacterium]|nr:alkaline phosphatase D family protein [Actinomycetota bacterium]